MRRSGRGDFDLVVIGRAMIAEPDRPGLVRRGERDKLMPFTPCAPAEALPGHLPE